MWSKRSQAAEWVSARECVRELVPKHTDTPTHPSVRTCSRSPTLVCIMWYHGRSSDIVVHHVVSWKVAMTLVRCDVVVTAADIAVAVQADTFL